MVGVGVGEEVGERAGRGWEEEGEEQVREGVGSGGILLPSVASQSGKHIRFKFHC